MKNKRMTELVLKGIELEKLALYAYSQLIPRCTENPHTESYNINSKDAKGLMNLLWSLETKQKVESKK